MSWYKNDPLDETSRNTPNKWWEKDSLDEPAPSMLDKIVKSDVYKMGRNYAREFPILGTLGKKAEEYVAKKFGTQDVLADINKEQETFNKDNPNKALMSKLAGILAGAYVTGKGVSSGMDKLAGAGKITTKAVPAGHYNPVNANIWGASPVQYLSKAAPSAGILPNAAGMAGVNVADTALRSDGNASAAQYALSALLGAAGPVASKSVGSIGNTIINNAPQAIGPSLALGGAASLAAPYIMNSPQVQDHAALAALAASSPMILQALRAKGINVSPSMTFGNALSSGANSAVNQQEILNQLGMK